MTLEDKVDKMMTNELPHIQARLDVIELKLGSIEWFAKLFIGLLAAHLVASMLLAIKPAL